jgi:hypothetical protein
MNNKAWALRLFASIAADLEPRGLREWWESTVSLEDRAAKLRCFSSILFRQRRDGAAPACFYDGLRESIEHNHPKP